jgi:hypothetical protein
MADLPLASLFCSKPPELGREGGSKEEREREGRRWLTGVREEKRERKTKMMMHHISPPVIP